MTVGYTPELDDGVRVGEALVAKVAQTLSSTGFKVNTVVEKGDIRRDCRVCREMGR